MNKEEKIVEIEEFKIVDVREFKKYINEQKEENKKLGKHFKQEEPFSNFVNRKFFVVGHALENIIFDSKNSCWYIDTRSYDLVQIGDVLTTYYYRWEFTHPLPKKLLKYIPSKMLKMSKLAPVLVGVDKVFVMPTMGGTVEKVLELVENNNKELFVVKNPEIID